MNVPGEAWLGGMLFCVLLTALSGCGTPGAPQPPSLKMPRTVTDLGAERNGDVLMLHWTNPKKTTDGLLIHEMIDAQICRLEEKDRCVAVGHASGEPGKEGSFQGTLTGDLVAGKPRPVRYSVELMSPKGQTAGDSNFALVLAGAAPEPVTHLSAEVRADGVALRWEAKDATPVRLHRKLVKAVALAPAVEKQSEGLMKPAPEALERDLMEDTPSEAPRAGTLDSSARFGEQYIYTAQRVVQVKVDGKSLELTSAVSAPVPVNVVDVFPPAVPQGLVAVYVSDEKTIDLSWQPDTEADLAGYIVYRIGSGDPTNGSGEADWMRVSGPQPVSNAAYSDASVQPGHTYRYRVSAIDQTGHESRRSGEAQESVPNP